ncbi:MAG TPA: alpha/beta hydrolase, partial [Solirubrobacteraceae bacterium]|nr:alpha/beta hydrolase [Solirubrobacteraceae bacterium]
MRPRLLIAAAAALAVAAGPGAAGATADMSWSACVPAGFQCGSLTVPLDRSGAVPGSVVLQAERVVAASNPTRTAVVALAGGPGQAAIPAAADFAAALAPALAERDLLVPDQRGTGASGFLRCAAFSSSSRQGVVAAARACAAQLGPARGFYRTADTVADLEDLRQAAGYERLVLVGVSYGTKVALDYAAAHPDRTAGLVLDSVVPPEGGDVFNRSTFRAMGPALAHLCDGGACRGITASPLRDLRTLVARAGRRPLRGVVVLPSGRRARVAIEPLDLYRVMLAGDLNPVLRAEQPGAVRSALRGDPAPVLRLAARAAGVSGIPAAARSQAPAPAADSDALFAATRCEESALPWDRAAGARTRARQAMGAAARLSRADVSPFTRDVALRSDVIPLCLGWPDASPPPPAPGPLPAVPTLILGGAADVRTPLQDARAVQARIPGARLVAVPDTGHSVLGSDLGTCAADAVAAFFGGGPDPGCPRRRLIEPTPLAPRSLAAVPGRDRVAKTLEALRRTVGDVDRQFLADAFAAGRATPPGARVGGLRAGSARAERAGTRLRRVEYVPGVLVSGFLPDAAAATATFTVAGPRAASGAVRVAGDGRVTGHLGGRRVDRR